MVQIYYVFYIVIFTYYLKHEHECFIGTIARIASVLNSFKNDPFYTYLVTLFTKEFLSIDAAV